MGAKGHNSWKKRAVSYIDIIFDKYYVPDISLHKAIIPRTDMGNPGFTSTW